MVDEEDFASTWRKPLRGIVVELPSGNKARVVGTMGMSAALEAGLIPNPLRDVIAKMIEDNEPTLPPDSQTDPQIIMQMNDLVNKTICECMVNPKVAIPPAGVNPATWAPEDPGTISIVDLTEEDKIFIYGVVQGGTTDLKQFRSQQAQLVDAMAGGPEIPVPAKSNGGAKRSRKRPSGVVPR